MKVRRCLACLALIGIIWTFDPLTTQAIAGRRDRELEIHLELAWIADPLVCWYYPCAHVSPSTIEVSGYIPDENHRQRALAIAQEFARHSQPPRVVQDRLQVHPGIGKIPEPRAQEETLRLARVAVARFFPGKEATWLLSAEASGRLTISGIVDSLEQKLEVSRKLRKVSGCRCVINQTRLDSKFWRGPVGAKTDQVTPSPTPLVVQSSVPLVGKLVIPPPVETASARTDNSPTLALPNVVPVLEVQTRVDEQHHEGIVAETDTVIVREVPDKANRRAAAQIDVQQVNKKAVPQYVDTKDQQTSSDHDFGNGEPRSNYVARFFASGQDKMIHFETSDNANAPTQTAPGGKPVSPVSPVLVPKLERVPPELVLQQMVTEPIQTGNREQGTESKDQWTRNRAQGTGNTGQAKGNKQRIVESKRLSFSAPTNVSKPSVPQSTTTQPRGVWIQRDVFSQEERVPDALPKNHLPSVGPIAVPVRTRPQTSTRNRSGVLQRLDTNRPYPHARIATWSSEPTVNK
ncbi:MAG: hypothetical protein ACFCD0_03945 [Gemmataceae bacterium]